MDKPLILITNDDGIVAPGIKALVDVVRKIGTPFVVAPDSPQSGQGHAITITSPLRLKKVNVFEGVEAYECTGTPVDCVKLAKNVLLKDREIAMCVSGINHGSNAAINILYSGTMSAAMEASLEGIKSIGFSLLDFSFEADFEPALFYVEKIIKTMMNNLDQGNQLLNVNIPNLSFEDIKGIKVCRQGKGEWVEDFKEATDPRGENYYWLTGKFKNGQAAEGTDLWALQNGYISIVPSQHDLTNYAVLDNIKYYETE